MPRIWEKRSGADAQSPGVEDDARTQVGAEVGDGAQLPHWSLEGTRVKGNGCTRSGRRMVRGAVGGG
jgi:hypothetical protein